MQSRKQSGWNLAQQNSGGETVRYMIMAVAIAVILIAPAWARQLAPDSVQEASVQDAPLVNLIDKRPPDQKRSKMESLTIWRCAYASARIGDAESGPDRTSALGNTLNSEFPELGGKAVVIKNYTVHLNGAAYARSFFAMTHSGAVAAAANQPVVGCGPDDLLGGYTPGEIPLTNSPVITVVDLVIDGRDFHFRSIADTDVDRMRRGRKGEDWKRNFTNASQKALVEIVPALRQFMGKTPAQ